MNLHIVFILIITIFLFCGCAVVHDDFERASAINTITAYREFVKKYPKTQESNKARSRIEKLYFDDANVKNNIESYEEYLSRYPNGTFTDEARLRLERLHYEQAKKTNSIDGYEKFLKNYRIGYYANKANTEIEFLYFEKAKDTNTVRGYDDFRCRYPKSQYKAEVIEALRPLAFEMFKTWAFVKKENSYDSYLAFWSKYAGTKLGYESLKKAMEISPEKIRYIGYGCENCIQVENDVVTCPDGTSPQLKMSLDKHGAFVGEGVRMGCFYKNKVIGGEMVCREN